MAWRIGVDSGGTFTDICLFDEKSGQIAVWKIPSTPADPSHAVAVGVGEALAQVAAQASDVSYFGHGTTVATNALIQHRGAATGLITSDGFRDLLEIGRQKRPELYDLQADKPPVLVERRLRREVPERLRHEGRIETALDEAAVRTAVRVLRDTGAEAVAICFLYRFLDSAHEEAARRIVSEEFPEAFVCASHEVAPEFREYERLSTTVVNAYLGPIMAFYIRGVADRLNALGVAATPYLTQSIGGVIGFDTAAQLPVRTVLSGPSTGVVGAQVTARLAGAHDIITFDMGGTSTDVALLQGGEARLAREAVVHGYPIKAPMLDIHTVGAGGGAIAFIDSGGLLKVGPKSAGADPGPACYDRGNDQPTVTDANLVLQTLNPTHLLGGRMHVRQDLARARRSTVSRPGWASMRWPPLRASLPWSRATWHGRSASSACSAAMTRAITPWSRSVVQDHCTPRGSRPNWISAACWCRATPASFVRWACCWRICAPISRRRGSCLCLRRSLARSKGSLPSCASAARRGSPTPVSRPMPGASPCRSTCAMPGKITSFPCLCPRAR